MEPGWHIWTSEKQAKALPSGMVAYEGAEFTAITGTVVPEGAAELRTDLIQWPKPHGAQADLGEGPQTFAVYEGVSVAYLPVVISSNAAPGNVTLTLNVYLQSCNDRVCRRSDDIPVTVELTVAPGVVGSANEPALFAGFDNSVLGKVSTAATKELSFPFFGWEFSLDQNGFWFFPLLLLVAFIGGSLLNFTPCVLPIIPLKIMGLSAAASGERKRTFMLGLAMSAGVVGFWLVLGALLSLIKGFDQISAFFLYPEFTISVGVFIAIMAVGMAGFFNVGLPQWVYAIEPKHETYGGSIIFGVMTAILSTPCTAPLMGAAAGWAVTTKQPSTILAVFLAIGAGMAFPYLVLSAFPQLARKMPKTGPASEVLKQVMGLLLLAAAAYFVGAGLNSILVEPSKIYWWVVSAIGVVAGVWLLIRTLQLAKTVHNRVIYVTVGLLIAVPSGMIGPAMTYEPLPWQRFSPQALEDAGKAGNVAVIDFTAEWCINCKVLKKTVLESGTVAPVLIESDVVLLKADTGVNELAQAKLTSIGRSSIPYLVVIAPSGEVVFESDAYTRQQVVDAVRKAQGKSVAAAQAARPGN